MDNNEELLPTSVHVSPDFRARFSFKISMKVGERLFSLSHMVTRLSLFLMLPVGFRIEVVCFGEGIGELRIDTENDPIHRINCIISMKVSYVMMLTFSVAESDKVWS